MMDLSELAYKGLCPYEDPRVPGGLPFALSLHVLNMLLSLSVVLLNAFLAWALWSRRRSRRRPQDSARAVCFVLNLVAGAVLGGCFELSCRVVDTICPLSQLLSRNEILCVLKMLVSVLQWMININMHAVIALDRYLLIVHSLRYRDLMTSRRAIALIALAWILSIVGAASIMANNGWEPGAQCVTHNLVQSWHVLAVQLPMNVLVFLIVAATHVRIRKEAARSQARHRNCCGSGADPEADAMAGASKAARLLYLVIGCYILSFCPIQIVLVLRACGVLTGDALYISVQVAWPLTVISLLVNPLLYTWKNAHLRADLKYSWDLAIKWVKHVSRLQHSQENCPAAQCTGRF